MDEKEKIIKKERITRQQDLIKMGITIIKRPGTMCVELWINDIFIAQADYMYINQHLEDKAKIVNLTPEAQTYI